MSLKAFHVFFVSVTTLGSLSLGVWLLRSGSHPALGVLSLVAAACLVTYGWWFLKKMKHVGYL